MTLPAGTRLGPSEITSLLGAYLALLDAHPSGPQAGMIIGAAAYMSPEQAKGKNWIEELKTRVTAGKK